MKKLWKEIIISLVLVVALGIFAGNKAAQANIFAELGLGFRSAHIEELQPGRYINLKGVQFGQFGQFLVTKSRGAITVAKIPRIAKEKAGMWYAAAGFLFGSFEDKEGAAGMVVISGHNAFFFNASGGLVLWPGRSVAAKNLPEFGVGGAVLGRTGIARDAMVTFLDLTVNRQ